MNLPRIFPARAPREVAALARAITLAIVALALVLLFESLGALASVDDGLRRRYVTLAETLGLGRETGDRVVVVVADRETIAAWGPPPWSAEQLAALVEPIAAGDPDVIAELGFTRMLGESGELGELELGELGRGSLLLRSRETQLESPWSGPGLVRGDLLLGPDSLLVELGARSTTLPPVPSRLPVRWLTPRSRLPVVSAHDVANGRTPAGTFARRVVVLGVSDPAYAMPVATPLGLMSPVEIEAHALAGLADDAIWAEPPPAAIYLGCLALALALLWMSARLRGLRLMLLMVGGFAALLLGDFVAYSYGWLRLGCAHAWMTGVAVVLGHWAYALARTSSALHRLCARVLQAATGPDAARADDDPGFWDDLAALGSEYARAHLSDAATTMLEREADGWALLARASAGLESEPDGAEALGLGERLDLRRAPFRGAWLTLRASWASLGAGALATLIVPLEHDGDVLGVWLVHARERVELEPATREGFEALGRQIAATLVRRRERSSLREQSARAQLSDRVETIIGGLRLLHDERRWAIDLLEQLPVRAVIATTWGELEFVDPRVRDELGRRFPELFADSSPAHGLAAMIARLSGATLDEAHRMMREVVQRGVELELPGRSDDGEVWVLSRIHSKRGIDLPGFRPAVHEHVLLTTRPAVAGEAVVTGKGRILRSA
jgi:CHASE2 domain-containing sensor protein/GAF domain-containing protein